MKQKIHKLSFDNDNDFELIGIVSSENDYKISWILNQLLNIELIKANSIEVISKKLPVQMEFSCYQVYDDLNMINYHLVSNKGTEGFFIEEQKQMDYILKISGELDFFDINDTVEKIKKSNEIITVLKIDKDNLKKETLNRLNID